MANSGTIKGFLRTVLFPASLYVLTAFPASAQMTIERCMEMARENYPQIRQLNLIEESAGYDIASVSKSWIPQLNISGKASYQSDVVEMPFDIPGFEFNLPHDQYSLVGEITQTIWDGGVSKSQKDIINSGASVQKQQVEVSLYSINERVQKIFLGILLIDEQIRQNDILMENLSRSERRAEAGMENGIAYKSDLDMIRVNILNCEQQKSEMLTTRKAYVDMLGRLTGTDMSGESFIKPQDDRTDYASMEIKRPEIMLYDAQLAQNSAQLHQLNSKISPKFSLSLQGGVGRPGLNMLKNEFQPYYVAGIRLQWDIGALYTRKDEIRKIDTEKRKIESDMETFLLNTDIEITEKQAAIDKAREMLERDREIIALRGSIRQAGEEQYSDGIITMTDLMDRIDDEHDAKVAASIHEIQLLMAIYDLKNSTGY